MASMLRSALCHLLPAMTCLILTGGLYAGANVELVLKIDGIVRVKEVPFQGARMIILSREDSERVVTTDLDHFQMSLELQSAYLFSFERADCVTKELYFDTHVPAEFLDRAPFDFPFKVTLEPPPPGYHFEYVGPVGYIRFYPEHKDFGYDTDYTRKGDPLLHERMKAVQARLDGPAIAPALLSTGDVPVPMPAGVLASEVMVEENDSIVPAEITSAPRIHRTGEGSMSSERPRRIATRYTSLSRPRIRPSPMTAIEHAPPAIAKAPERPPDVLEESPMRVDRTEELITERNRVTTIVRITRGGDVTEYRRVAHAYGPVFYFKDGESCSDRVYLEGVGDGRTP